MDNGSPQNNAPGFEPVQNGAAPDQNAYRPQNGAFEQAPAQPHTEIQFQQPPYQPQQYAAPYFQPAPTPVQNEKGTRLFLRIANVFIALICAAAILGYLLMPLWRVGFEIKFDEKAADLIDEAVGQAMDETRRSLDPDKNVDDRLTKELTKAVTDYLRAEEIDFSIGFGVKTSDVLASLFSSDLGFMKDSLADNAAQIADDLAKKAGKLIKPAAAAAAKCVILSELDRLLEDSGGEIKAMMKQCGIDNKWIEGRLQDVIDMVNDENATVSSVTDTIMSITDDAVRKVLEAQHTEEADRALEEYFESRGDIVDELRESLKNIADDDEKVSFDTLISDLVEGALSGSDKAGNPDEATLDTLASKSSVDLKNSKNTLEDVIVSMLDDVPQDTANTVVITVKALAAILVLTMFTWLYLIIKIAVKFAGPNPGIKIWLPIVFGWWPFVLLTAIPWCAMTFSKSILSGTLGESGVPDAAQNALGLLENANFTFFSGSFVAALAALALLLLSFIYVSKRKKMKLMTGK